MPAVDIPSFIPKSCPKDTIIDCGHNLTKDELQDLSKTCSNLSYSPKVIILPKNYFCQNIDDLAIALAKNWHLRGHGLLMVIDLRSAKVKVITSKFLHENYIDNDFLKQNILKKEFLPNIREGNLYLAIKDSLKAINNKIENIKLTSNHIVQSSDTTYNSAINSAPSPSPTNYNNGFSGFGILPVLIFMIIAFVIYKTYSKKRDENKSRIYDYKIDQLKKIITVIFQNIDRLSQASEYIDTKENAELTRNLTFFYANISIINKSYSSILEKYNKRDYANLEKDIPRLMNMLIIINKDLDYYLNKVEKLTGTKTTVTAESSFEIEEKANKKLDDSLLVNKNNQANVSETASNNNYKVPGWLNTAIYSSNNVMNIAGSALSLVTLLNQFELNRKLSDIQNNMMIDGYDYNNIDQFDFGDFNQHSNYLDGGSGSAINLDNDNGGQSYNDDSISGYDYGNADIDFGGADTDYGNADIDFGGSDMDFGGSGDWG